MVAPRSQEPAGAPVGRDHELRSIIERARAAAGGSGRAVLIRGPLGIGKTTLLSAVLGELGDATTAMLTANCPESGSDLCGVVRLLFTSLPGSTPVPEYRDDDDRWLDHAAMDGPYRAIADLASAGPVVLAVDDVHRCDEMSLNWLGYLLRRIEDLPVFLMMTQLADPGDLCQARLSEFAASSACLTLDLPPLDADAVGLLLRSVLVATPDQRFVTGCLDLTGGSPLLLERMLTHLGDRVSPTVDHVPMLEELGREVVVRSLVDRLPADALGLARAIAVLGGERAETVAVLAGVPTHAAASALRGLRSAGLLQPDRLDYAHDAARAVVLAAMPPAELDALRERTATLVNYLGRPVEQVAEQVMLLGEVPRGWMVAILRDAAAVELNRGMPTASVRYLEQALKANADSVPLLIELAHAQGQVDPPAALRNLERALELVNDLPTRVPIVVLYSVVSLMSRSCSRAFGLAARLLDALEAERGPVLSSPDCARHLLAQSAVLISGLLEKTTVNALGARFRDVVPPDGDTAEERQFLAVFAALGLLRGASADTVADRAGRAVRVGDLGTGGVSAFFAALSLSYADHAERALATADALVEHARGQGDARLEALGTANRALIHHFNGRLDLAESDAEHSFAVVMREGWTWTPEVTMPQVVLGAVLVDKGELVRAEELFDTIASTSLEGCTLEYHWFLMARARARAALDDPEGALKYLWRCGESLAEAGIENPVVAPWWYDTAGLLAVLGRAAEGEAVLESVEDAVARWNTPRAAGMALTARGLLVAGDDGIGLLEEATRLLATSPARLAHAMAEYFLGQRLLRRGDSKQARERLRHSIDLSVLGRGRRQLYLSRQALTEAGGRLRGGTASLAAALSGSQRRVADLAAGGATNREIAESLFLSLRTVELHLTNVYRKLRIKGRAELAEALRSDGGPR